MYSADAFEESEEDSQLEQISQWILYPPFVGGHLNTLWQDGVKRDGELVYEPASSMPNILTLRGFPY